MEKEFKKMDLKKIKSSDLKPLKIKCSSTNCKEGLHCFSRRMKKAEEKYGKQGVCFECGEDSIDWERMHKNDLTDSKFMIASLNKEFIRTVFWEMKIDRKAIESAQKKGKSELRVEARKLLKNRIGKYNDFIDSRQTPLGKDNIINYAQHATATCCRECLQAWHNIPLTNVLTDNQLDFCTNLVMKFIEERVPAISDQKIEKKMSA
jgi:hypothetical protein